MKKEAISFLHSLFLSTPKEFFGPMSENFFRGLLAPVPHDTA